MPPTKCQHPEVTEHHHDWPGNRDEPSERLVWYTCTECGRKLEQSDLDADTIIHK